MEIQSLSVCVPAGCPNKCKFCVAHMHREDYKNQIELNHRFRDLYKKDFMKRLEFARDNGCNTIVLTGNGEPLCNHRFLEFFSEWNNQLRSSFKWIELQTSGVMLDDEKLRWLRNDIGVSTISLSLSDVFVSQKNYEYNGTPQNLQRDNFINHTCSEIKRYDFNLRLSLNMTDSYNKQSIDEIFKKCKELGANQITFRELYESPISETPENKWIRKHKIADKKLFAIKKHIETHGRKLERLSFGAVRYSVDGYELCC